jgi:hypothetical protein
MKSRRHSKPDSASVLTRLLKQQGFRMITQKEAALLAVWLPIAQVPKVKQCNRELTSNTR